MFSQKIAPGPSRIQSAGQQAVIVQAAPALAPAAPALARVVEPNAKSDYVGMQFAFGFSAATLFLGLPMLIGGLSIPNTCDYTRIDGACGGRTEDRIPLITLGIVSLATSAAACLTGAGMALDAALKSRAKQAQPSASELV